MGNKICFHPRVILVEDIALHFKSSNLVRDVIPIIEKWRSDGAELCFGQREFQLAFDVVTDIEDQFRTFDTDHNGKVDAHEVLMVYILLSHGDVARKIDTVFSIFDYAGCKGHLGSVNFDEAMIMVEACVKGIQKVCNVDFNITADETFFHCKSLFDMHHIAHTGRISLRQFTNWCSTDPSPKAFINLFHEAQGLPDIYAAVQRVNLEQAQVFRMLAQGHLYVRPEELLGSAAFRRAVKEPKDDELQVLVAFMLDDRGKVSSDRYHMVLRPWNIFNECDLDSSGELDDKEIEIILWIQLRKKPEAEFVGDFMNLIDEDKDGRISRTDWVKAVVESHDAAEAQAASRAGQGKPQMPGKQALQDSLRQVAAVR